MATNTVRQVSLTGWRAKAAAMLAEAGALIEGAMKASEGGCNSYRLLEIAAGEAERMAQEVSAADSDPGDLLGDVYDLAAVLMGASCVPDATMAAKRLIGDAQTLCDHASEYLDMPGGDDGDDADALAYASAMDEALPLVELLAERLRNELAGDEMLCLRVDAVLIAAAASMRQCLEQTPNAATLAGTAAQVVKQLVAAACEWGENIDTNNPNANLYWGLSAGAQSLLAGARLVDVPATDGEDGGSNVPEMRISAEENPGAANLDQARELVDAIVDEVQELYAFSPNASGADNTLANALLSGMGHAIDRAAGDVDACESSIGEALALLGVLEDMLPNGEKARALWQRTNGLISGLRVVLGRPVEGDAEAAQAVGSVQPLSNAGKTSPVPVSQAAEASPRDPVRMLLQSIMDELCNANPKDCEEEITKCLALMDGLKPYLEGVPHAWAPEGAARASGGNVLDAERGERTEICCKAACEMFGLAGLVREQIADDSGGAALRSMLRRVQTLSNCVLSAVDDKVDTAASIRERMEAV